VLLQRVHERHAAHALDAIAAATTGRHGRLHHVAGVLSWIDGLPCLDPWALGCDGLVVVPDFAAASGALAGLPLGLVHSGHDDPCRRHLDGLRQHLATLLHHGLVRLPRQWGHDAQQLARRLEAAGLRALAQGLRSVSSQALEGQVRAADTAMAPALMQLLALLQLHLDAAMLVADEPPPETDSADIAEAA